MRLKFFTKISIILLTLVLPINLSFAVSVSDLENQIKARNNDIAELQTELQRLQAELSEINNKSNTLSKSVSELDATRKKLATEIKIAQEKIAATNANIERLEIQIGEKETSINKSKKAISSGIRKLYELDSVNVSALILSQKSLSEAFNQTNEIIEFQKELRVKMEELRLDQEYLSQDIAEKENAVSKLSDYKKEVDSQKVVVEKNKEEKSTLLKETKNQEAEYQKIIAEKERLRAQFEAELESFESQLQFILDPNSIPKAKHGVLAWPLDYILITQGFGLTKDSSKLYSYRSGAWSGKHTGVDFRANGDKVKAMESGKVVDFGNTDGTCPRASFGGWMLIQYDNGLSSIYSHLSSFVAKKGQRVNKGDVVAYSGNTGYSTGPHLDVKVVPANAVSVKTWPSKGCPGKDYTTPIVAGATYLDPLSYLPKATDDMFK